MKIVYFYQYFTTPKGSYGTRVYEFTKKWVEAGHDVTVVTSIYAKSDIRATRFIEDQVVEGVKLKVLNITIDNKQSVLKRIWTFVQYGVLSSWYALTMPADVVIASSGPITVGLPALVARYLRNRKLVFEVRDLWPEAAIDLGVIRNKTVQKLAFWLEKTCYKASSRIVTLSPGMSDNIEARFHLGTTVSVPNSANIELFGKPVDASLPAFFADKKVALYSGNIGSVNNSELLFKAAKELKRMGRHDIIILMVGDGQLKEKLAADVQAEGLDNFILHGLVPKRTLAAYVQHALVSLVPLKGTPILDTSSPNKLFESMAAGVPVIQNTRGWIKTFLDEHACGFTVDPDDPTEIVAAMIRLADDPELGKRMGAHGRALAFAEFDKDILSKRMLQALEDAAKS
jgi:glycosyltransferase involved in cell wall biosynthesis